MLRKIISGGQTGADRAGLDFALQAGLEHGGYVAKGRKPEDGRIDDRYQLIELSSSSYVDRTKRNVEESGGTVIFSLETELTGGSELTRSHAIQADKAVIHIHDGGTEKNRTALLTEVWRLRNFVDKNGIEVLNVARPRESKEPGVYGFTLQMLRQYWENRNAPDDISEYLHSKGLA